MDKIVRSSNIEDAFLVFNMGHQGKVCKKAFESKHLKNPFRLNDPFCFYYVDDKPVGLNAFMGTKLYVNGNQYYITQSNDTFVSSEYRGKKIFTKVVTDFVENGVESELTIGLPNEKSYPGFLKMGWKCVAQLSHFVYFMNPIERFIYNKFWKLITNTEQSNEEIFNKFRMDMSDRCNISDEEFNIINSRNDVFLFRSKDFFEWKAEYNQKFDFRYLCYRTTSLMGYLVYHFKRFHGFNILVVDDWFLSDNLEQKQKCKIFKKMLSVATSGFCFVMMPIVNTTSSDFDIINKMHFVDICKPPFKYRGTPLIVSPNGKDIVELERLCFRQIDSDVLN